MLIADRFEIEKELGRGGIGVVYKAIDRKGNNRPVVVKILMEQKDDGTRDWVERHFLKEAKALKLINHPGVVQLIDVGKTSDDKAFFAMEYVNGYDLRSQIDPKKGLIGDYERVARIMNELCDAISAAHEKGIYHRDLKPENVMLQKPKTFADDEQVKVIDFGIATVKESFDEKTKTTQLLAGSIHYMAPEQLENRPSASSDIYSLGAIAYELVTGRPPFMPEAQSYVVAIVQLMQMQKDGVRIKPKDLRPSLPEQAQVIILKALAFNPEDRYKVARNFGNDLAKALTNDWDDEDRATTFIKETNEIRKQQTYITEKSFEKEKTLIEIPVTKVIDEAKVSNISSNDTKTFSSSSETLEPIVRKNITEVQFSGEDTKNTLIKHTSTENTENTENTNSNANKIEKQLEILSDKVKENTKGQNSAINKLFILGIVIISILTFLASYKVFFNQENKAIITNNNTPLINTSTKEKTLSYWMLWSPSDKKTQPPIRLTDEINEDVFFKENDVIEFFINSPGDGYLYIIHEGEELGEKGNYTILFPSPNNSNTKVALGELISKKVITSGRDKVEKVWMIWTSKQILGLEQAFIQWKGKDDLSEIKDEKQELALKELLNKSPMLEGITIEKDEVNKKMKVISSKDPLIYYFILRRQ